MNNQSSPYQAGLAALYSKRFQVITAFPTCYIPLWLSPLSELGDPEVIFSELLLSVKGIDQWVEWRTSSAYRIRLTLVRFSGLPFFGK